MRIAHHSNIDITRNLREIFHIGSKADLTYLGNISAGLTDLEARADEMEVAVAGQKENRLNEITLEEVRNRRLFIFLFMCDY